MLSFFLSLLQGFAKKILSLLLVAAIAFSIWNYYKDKRERRTFIMSFSNVEGLRTGSGVYANGVRVGKVIKIFPLGNSSSVGVKCVITDKSFPSPKSSVTGKLITNYEDGGGKVIEIVRMMAGSKEEGTGLNPYLTKYSLGLMRDFFQLSKDFAANSLKLMNSKESQEYSKDLEHSVQNTLTSLEYGTLKNDIEHDIKDLNKKLKKYESQSPKDKEKQTKKIVEDQVQALKKTTKTLGTLSDPYREKQ